MKIKATKRDLKFGNVLCKKNEEVEVSDLFGDTIVKNFAEEVKIITEPKKVEVVKEVKPEIKKSATKTVANKNNKKG